jgi:hypothetical protein
MSAAAQVQTEESREALLADDARTQWLVPELQTFPLAARRCLVRNPLTAAALELSSGEHAVLSACEGGRMLAEHEAHAAQRLSAPAEHRPAIRELLERCARAGLLMSLPDLVRRFGAPSESPAAPFAGVAVRTCDRPDELRRVLESAKALQARTGVAYPWHVFDDSRRAESRRANGEVLRACGSLEANYHGASAVAALARELGAAHPELAGEIAASLDAARDGEATYGRPLNFLLLRFAGHRLLIIDDDMLLDPRRPPRGRSGVEVGAAREPAYWYETIDAAYAACPSLDADPIEAHLRWLGMSLAQAWAQAERTGLALRELDGEAAARFAPDARIAVTRTGLLGDPGWAAFSAQQLVLSEETRQWLAADPDAVRYAFESQIQWRGWLATGLVPQVLPSSTLLGIDNSRLMPPTLRAAAGEDIVFGEAVACVYRNAWTVNLPFALPHLRTERRQWLTPRDSLVGDPARCLVLYARACAPAIAAEDPQERMLRLGGIFRDFGEASDTALVATLEEQAAEYASSLRFVIQEQLDDAATPDAWKRVVRQWLASPILQLDQESLRAAIAPPAAVRALAREYGRTLTAWPQLWAHCRERSNRGPR